VSKYPEDWCALFGEPVPRRDLGPDSQITLIETCHGGVCFDEFTDERGEE